MILTVTTALLAVSLNSPIAVQDYIASRAQAYNYPVVKALAIAKCESGFAPNAANSTSSAKGIFQFVDRTWYGVMTQMGLPTTTPKTDPHYNIEAGLYLLDKEGDRHWKSSEPCWGPKYRKYLDDTKEPLEGV